MTTDVDRLPSHLRKMLETAPAQAVTQLAARSIPGQWKPVTTTVDPVMLRIQEVNEITAGSAPP
jgi:hypothetical protein